MITRVFTDKEINADADIFLCAEETKYLKIMRVAPNETLELFSEKKYATAVFCEFTKTGALLKTKECFEYINTKPLITAIHCITEFNKPELIIQKFTELGIDKIVIVESELSKPIKEQKKSRLMRAVLEAVRQCRRYSIPSLEYSTLKNYVDKILTTDDYKNNKTDIIVFSQAARRLCVDKISATENIYFITGPESGFSIDEQKYFKEKNLSEYSINSNILRAETAAICAASLVCLKKV